MQSASSDLKQKPLDVVNSARKGRIEFNLGYEVPPSLEKSCNRAGAGNKELLHLQPPIGLERAPANAAPADHSGWRGEPPQHNSLPPHFDAPSCAHHGHEATTLMTLPESLDDVQSYRKVFM